MRPLSALFPYQSGATAEVVARRQIAVLLEPGLGKTVITLSALAQARALPALVVAPASIVRSVWPREASAWKHLSKLRVVPLVGTPAVRAARLAQPADVYVVSYELLPWLTRTVEPSRFKAIVFDELSKMKAPGTQRFKSMRKWSAPIPFRVGLTGTPVGNHLLDLWGEMYMVAGEKPLGPNFYGYRARYFYPAAIVRNIPVNWTPFEHSERKIHEAVKPWTYVLPPQREVTIPPVRVNEIPVEMPAEISAQAKELTAKLHTQLADGVELEAIARSTLAVKLRQFASGAVYTDTKEHRWTELHDAKLSALRDLAEELQGEPLLVFYWYNHELSRLKRNFPEAVAFDGSPALIDRWNGRKIEMLLCHPQSAAHGLNLQHGGHNICWFALPWSWELWKQGNGREARTGQKAPWVNAHVLLCGEADALVLSALNRKGDTERNLLEGVQ